MRWIVESLLTRHEDDYTWVPLLAKSYEVSTDQKTFTFTLRQGVQFHDGSEMTAEDVAFSFNVHKSDLYGTSMTQTILDNLLGIEVLDKYTIRFQLKEPRFTDFHTIAVMPIVAKSLYGNKENTAKLNKTVVGTGPYKLKQYVIGDHLTLMRNPQWWGRDLPFFKYKFNFDQIYMRFVSDELAKLQMLQSGSLDYAGISLNSVTTKTQSPPWGEKVFVERANHLGVFTTQASLFLNLRKPIFASLKTRQALQMLLNREWLNQTIRGGLSVLATGPWHSLNEFADPSVKPVQFQMEKAQRLLRQDGWQDRNGDGILEKELNGQLTEFRFQVYYPIRDHEKYLTVYQSDLKKAGIVLDMQLMEWNLFLKKIDNLDFDGYIVGRGFPGKVDFDPSDEWHSKNIGPKQGNATGYQNPKVDVLLLKNQIEPDRGRRLKILREAYRLISADAPQIFLFNEREMYLARTRRVKFEKVNYKYLLGVDYWWLDDTTAP